jgi:hypothetical protein
MMNDETEQFEQRLRRQTVKAIPAEWRAEILESAREGQVVRHASRITHQSFLSTFSHQLSTLLWPHPKAWAGLAAVWVIIFAVNFSVRDTSPGLAAKSAPPSLEVIVELKKQQRMFAELVGANEPPDADRRRNFSPKPRSERAEILVT